VAPTSRRRVGKSAPRAEPHGPGRPSGAEPFNGPGAAFLLAQLGAHAAAKFAERIADLDLTPPQAGLLRAVSATPGQSQQAVARQLRTPPSRLVALVDDLDERGVLERRRNLEDRRLHALYVTDAGAALLRKIGQVARAHDDAVCASLDPAERAQLRALLARIAEEQGLTPGVHPGYRTI
jgi:DNA-binding MarR family transcriptional regulator